jgi:hypothetical protein
VSRWMAYGAELKCNAHRNNGPRSETALYRSAFRAQPDQLRKCQSSSICQWPGLFGPLVCVSMACTKEPGVRRVLSTTISRYVHGYRVLAASFSCQLISCSDSWAHPEYMHNIAYISWPLLYSLLSLSYCRTDTRTMSDWGSYLRFQQAIPDRLRQMRLLEYPTPQTQPDTSANEG